MNFMISHLVSIPLANASYSANALSTDIGTVGDTFTTFLGVLLTDFFPLVLGVAIIGGAWYLIRRVLRGMR